MSTSDKPSIELSGVTTNNLKSVDAAFPLGEISVVTGVSGSGKSSLVFDTLYAEAYRRYVESLSSFARQYLQALPKPAMAGVKNLPPAIAVRQTHGGGTSRSTVGTASELEGLLRVLYTHLASIQCNQCGGEVRKDHPEAVAASTLARHAGQKLLVVAPLERWGKVAAKELKSQLETAGFTRLLPVGGGTAQVIKLAEAKAADLKGAGVVVDRVTIGDEAAPRLRESLQLAFKVGRGKTWLIGDSGEREAFSTGLDCPRCGIAYMEPSAALLSFNHPLGACATCQGFGLSADLDWEKVIPDRTKSLAEKGVAAWNFGKFAEYYSWAKTSAKRNNVDFEKAFEDYSESDWEWLKHGEGREFDGVLGFFSYLDSKKYKAHYRIHAARYRKYVICAACKGDRLKPEALACKVQGLSIAEASRLTIDRLSGWVDSLSEAKGPGASLPTGGQGMGVEEALKEANARLNYLRKIGVGYLSLDRTSRTLSGGEFQRINMARCLGSALTDTLFCLDEPSSGLHARDSANLLGVIRELRDQGNTVVMVEHERRLIAGADHLIEIGPKAGHEGGHLVYAGAPRPNYEKTHRGIAANRKLTRFIELKGAKTHNLKGIDVRIPVGAITAVCGVSGSGKTSLIQHTLYPLAARAIGVADARIATAAPMAETIGPASLLKAHSDIMLVSQASLARSSRSNIATYLGLMDEIRKILADQPMARKLGLKAGAFSFNNAKEKGGGRCETCKGLGVVTEDMSFLGEMEVICPACNGRRFEDAVLAVEYLGKNLLGILSMTVSEAREFFYDRPHIAKACDLVIGMGMGYITLGQGTSSFSGGEAQRLKLLSLMGEVKTGRPSLLILDEPTTGLSDSDVANLLKQLRALADLGHTLIVVEHHLEVLQSADWLIEIGPEAGEAGGRLVFEGPPSGLAARQESGSPTAPFLREVWA